MAGIFGAITHLLSGENEDTKLAIAAHETIPTTPEEWKKHLDWAFANQRQRFPDKIYNIDIDSFFPADVMTLENLDFLSETTEEEHEEKITDIMDTGIREFQSKFLTRIDQAFQLQVENISCLFSHGLNKVFDTIENELEREVIEIQNIYDKRIAEFDTTINEYAKVYDAVMEERKKHFEEIADTFNELNFITQKTADILKSELNSKIRDTEIKIHQNRMETKANCDEKLQQVLNIGQSRRWLIEEAYKTEIQNYKFELDRLNSENQDLEDKIEHGRIQAMTEFNRQEHQKFMREKERQEEQLQVKSLKKKLESLEKQNQEMIQVHEHRVTNIIETHDLRNEHFKSEYKYFKRMDEETINEFQEDLEHFQESMNVQTTVHQSTYDGMKNDYREKMATLAISVNNLHWITNDRVMVQAESIQSMLSANPSGNQWNLQSGMTKIQSEISAAIQKLDLKASQLKKTQSYEIQTLLKARSCRSSLCSCI